MRRAGEIAVRNRQLKLEELALLIRRYDEALSGYTYLSRDEIPEAAPAPAAVFEGEEMAGP